MNTYRHLKILTITLMIIFSIESATHLAARTPLSVNPMVSVNSIMGNLNTPAIERNKITFDRVFQKPIQQILQMIKITRHITQAINQPIEKPLSQEAINLKSLRSTLNSDIVEIEAAVISIGNTLKSDEAKKLVQIKTLYAQGEVSLLSYLRSLINTFDSLSFNPEGFQTFSDLKEKLTQKNRVSLSEMEVDWEKLFEEVDILYNQALRKSASGLIEKIMVRGIGEFYLIQRIVNQEAISSEVEAYFDGEELKRLKTMLSRLNQYLENEGEKVFSIAQFEELIIAAKNFYNSQTLATNLQNRIVEV